jgi:hypothetical protein
MAYKNYEELWRDRFAEFLKEGSDPNPATSTDPKDESEAVLEPVELRDEPDTGEKPAPDDNQAFGTGVKEEHEAGQSKLLDKAFACCGPSGKAEKALIAQNFKTKDYESRAPLLRSKLSHAKTLMQRVREAVGFH